MSKAWESAPRACQHCGVEFSPRTASNIYCSVNCLRRVRILRDQARRPTVCRLCGLDKPRERGRRLCNECLDKRRPIWERESAKRKAERLKLAADEANPARRFARDAPAGQSWCARCQQYLPSAEFGKRTTGKSVSYCSECNSLYLYERRLLQEFGITIEQYEAMLAHQEGRCAICLSTPRTRRLSVDHDHKTGTIRGLLCTRCNHRIIGSARESSAILRRAAMYLDKPPATDGTTMEELNHLLEAELDMLTEDVRGTSAPWAVVLCDETKPVGEWLVICDYDLIHPLPPGAVVVEKTLR